MTTRVATPQSRCRAGVARRDITPPVGIYHRMWGAALHDQATGVHRPLTASLLWLEPVDGPDSAARVILSLDHCILETSLQQDLAADVAVATGLDPACVLVTLTHTHGSGWMALSRSEFPGGHLIAPYLEDVRQKVRPAGRRNRRQQTTCRRRHRHRYLQPRQTPQLFRSTPGTCCLRTQPAGIL